MAPTKMNAISRMFANQKAQPSTECPVCNQKASLREIDNHLNNGCPSVPEKAGIERTVEPTAKDDDCFNDSDSDYENLEVATNSPSLRQPSQALSITSSKSQREKTPSPKKIKLLNHSPSKQEDFDNIASEFDENNQLKHVPLTQSKRQDPNHTPYYLANFETILRGVLDETDDARLFDEEDLRSVKAFRDLSLDARKLYVRLFQRKYTWILSSSINYDEIHWKEKSLDEIVGANLLKDNSKLDSLEATLKLLQSANVKKICKDFNLTAKGSHKEDFIESLLKHSKKKSLFGLKSATMEQLIMKKAAQHIGSCYILEEAPRRVFLRIFSLYSLSNWWDERENDKGQPAPQMTTLLLQNSGKIVFPNYEIIRKSQIFRHKADLLHFEKSINFESRLSEITESKDFEKGPSIAEDCREFFSKILTDTDLQSHVLNLPIFLRKFTSGSVMGYILTKCVEVYEKLKNYSQAVSILKFLLSQSTYLPDYRGLWFERLALDTDHHLKMSEEAILIIKKALNDDFVRVGRRLTLCQRVSRILQAKKNEKLKEKYYDMFRSSPNWVCPPDPPEITIQGKQMPKENIPGGKSVFMYESYVNDNGEVFTENILCSVEEYVHEYYKKELGFTNGLHAEGSLINTVCWLLFWDVVYDVPVPDAFRGPHQATPLDLSYDVFYTNRKREFDARLDDLEKWPFDCLSEFVNEMWDRCSISTASMCNWELFKDPSEICGLLKCLTGKQWRAICERLIKNHRHTRSGFPDLTLWNPEKQVLNFVEVKGPNDSLSTKQILWLEYLNFNNITALVCHVEAVNARKLVQAKKISPEKSNSETSTVRKRTRKTSEDDFSKKS